MRRPLVAGNWKMHGTRESVDELVQGILKLDVAPSVDVAVFPVALHVDRVISTLCDAQVIVGGQNCAQEASQGALTGEVSAAQLADAGCRMVLIGHSERRQLFHEDDSVVSRKFAAAQSCGLTPVLCVGETLEQRQADNTLEVIAGQLGSVVRELGIKAFAQAVVAYEPVWAIGTGLTATPEQAQAVHAAIRDQLASEDEQIGSAIRLLYGGSVKAANAAELFEMPDIDGALVGGASLNADEFGAIIRAAGRK